MINNGGYIVPSIIENKIGIKWLDKGDLQAILEVSNGNLGLDNNLTMKCRKNVKKEEILVRNALIEETFSKLKDETKLKGKC